MTKQDVISQITKQTGLDPQISRSIIEAYFELVKTAVGQGETVYVRSFGSFGPKQRAAKVARNITQNTALRIEAHTIPYFKPSLEFVNQVRAQKVGIDDEKAPKSKTKKEQ
jgi:DNA-binding protein HU-beta